MHNFKETKVGQIHNGTVTFDVFVVFNKPNIDLIVKNTPHRNPPTEIYQFDLRYSPKKNRLIRTRKAFEVIKGHPSSPYVLFSIYRKAHLVANEFLSKHGYSALTGSEEQLTISQELDKAWGSDTGSSQSEQDKVSERLYDITMNKEGEAYDGEMQELLGKWQDLTGKRAPGFMEDRIPLTVDIIAESMDHEPVSDQLPGGLADFMPDEAYDEEQIAKGIKVELEHTDDVDKAKEIAKDHLAEDPKYYDKLEKIEPHHTEEDKSAYDHIGKYNWPQ